MLTAIALVLTFIAGYTIGNNIGVAKTMLKVQGLIMEMQAIVQMWEGHQEEWNEDKL